jgi:hypothetical protein
MGALLFDRSRRFRVRRNRRHPLHPRSGDLRLRLRFTGLPLHPRSGPPAPNAHSSWQRHFSLPSSSTSVISPRSFPVPTTLPNRAKRRGSRFAATVWSRITFPAIWTSATNRTQPFRRRGSSPRTSRNGMNLLDSGETIRMRRFADSTGFSTAERGSILSTPESKRRSP